VYIERHAAEELTLSLSDAGARLVQAEAIESARVEAGYPVFGIDMTEDTIPLEAGIEDRAISLTKGCYVGQEVIIRVLHRGHGRVVRKLVGLRLDGVVPRGTRLLSADRDVGFVTSAAESPRAGALAMGYVHRDFLAAGTALHAETSAGRVPATVTERVMTSKG
jgi:folate-binding protein YgfZ